MIRRRTLLAAPATILPAIGQAPPGHAAIGNPAIDRRDTGDAPATLGLRAYARRSTNELVLRDDSGAIYAFRAAFGREPGPKQRRDDARTPVGDYMLHPARASARWRWFHPVDYPNQRDISAGAARGLRPSQLGDEIGIHGYGSWPPTDLVASHGVGWNWTSGCIAVSHDEIEIVRMLVRRPIPLRIDP